MRGATAVIDRPTSPRHCRKSASRRVAAPASRLECLDGAPSPRVPRVVDITAESTAIADIWRRFKSLPRESADAPPTGASSSQQLERATLRDWLIVHYMAGHVRRIALRLHAQLPPQVDFEDLVNEAYDALVRLIEQFDMGMRTTFETYSSPRLLGAMRDYLRRIDPASRQQRQRAKRLQNAAERFSKANGRGASFEELRGQMNLSDGAFKKVWRDARLAIMIPFDHGAPDSDRTEDAAGMDGFEDHRAKSPLSHAERADLRDWITRGFARRDRLILVLYYYEQMTMRDIGVTLGCSESRVSQRLDSILSVLRARLDHARARRELVER